MQKKISISKEKFEDRHAKDKKTLGIIDIREGNIDVLHMAYVI